MYRVFLRYTNRHGKANTDKELSACWRDQLQNQGDTSVEYDTHDVTLHKTGLGLEFGKDCKVNHSVEKQMPAVHATHIRVSDKSDRYGAGNLSKYSYNKTNEMQ
jgi:hypothetical protein